MINRILIIVIALEVVLFLIFLFNFATGAPRSSQKELTPSPSPAISEIELTGWFAAWDQNLAESSLPKVMQKFHTFSPMLYRVMSDGSLGRHNIRNRNTMIMFARKYNIPLAPVITDEGDSGRINKLLNDPNTQEKFIQDLINEAIGENFMGWSIDIEQLNSQDKQAFSRFVKNMSLELHKNNLKLFIIVFARKEKETYDPSIAHDYGTIGEYADQVQLMTYNFNNDSTDPGGQAPLEWYREVLTYATKTIPKEKILVGLSTHGYDWGAEVVGLTYPEVVEIIKQKKLNPTYNVTQSSQMVSYQDTDGQRHSLWFEDAKTIYEKMKIAMSEFGINKFAFWRISAEDPKVWDIVPNN
ncbi:MAG: hypothetical protein A3C30_00910 [Candidatus Levybacteria bacterium RIFCSPHIGHO2_02_FULL_40_18]|nr:MAG: hypothetical protein A2869_03025 [Candidatus Levybacteria bacterium RIFCSPHIGHO2_01_FULL_40_58]OGH27258.1 MAG: hypothetical protein A3C30_00910 [Candidatus Levybacteria bacterium RIFCSPHIGHO2_02_FULL_40_18]OGH31117.1 MAG: hypothetical protein A3E43_05320 [Candidatus Levybacteria bacterium RIFCSPHIGHO2_12_FULL_40_31]OGH40715.1 MAG: hypothetical protein A2894_03120 [Candidatus Levybacteria bacterium RIFCSPLOWO2_01_FULL_40_64]OGH49354.1 MAG: hypothetical protein A3I54_01760 [Candidatus Lev